MRDVEQLKKISRAVEETLKADFDNVRIYDVKVISDVDFDGDDVLKIEIFFEGKPKDLNARVVSGAVRHVRPKLRELGEKAFPLLSFISRGDAGMKFEPA